jgi:hypothetical protein
MSTTLQEPPNLTSEGSSRFADPLFRVGAYAAGFSVLVVLGLMIGTTTRDALPVFQYQGSSTSSRGASGAPGSRAASSPASTARGRSSTGR